jgi:hypothetical protein
MSSYAHPEKIASIEGLTEHLNDPNAQTIEVSSLGDPTFPAGHIPGVNPFSTKS